MSSALGDLVKELRLNNINSVAVCHVPEAWEPRYTDYAYLIYTCSK